MKDIFDGVYNAGRNAGYSHEVAKSLAEKAVKREKITLLGKVAKNLERLAVMKSKKWVSTHETGSHLLIDGKGNVIAGAGGALTKKPEDKKPEKKKEAPKAKDNGWQDILNLSETMVQLVSNIDGHKVYHSTM